ncbi:hypothetical protein HMPREF1147_1636 [Selenomonas sp. FOBRC9]|nr:hypothetical protein HMPREF1147_1636 [Selenomonas sp. FOBRC9]
MIMFLNKLAVQLALAINAPKDYNKRKKQRDIVDMRGTGYMANYNNMEYFNQ